MNVFSSMGLSCSHTELGTSSLWVTILTMQLSGKWQNPTPVVLLESNAWEKKKSSQQQSVHLKKSLITPHNHNVIIISFNIKKYMFGPFNRTWTSFIFLCECSCFYLFSLKHRETQRPIVIFPEPQWPPGGYWFAVSHAALSILLPFCSFSTKQTHFSVNLTTVE